MKVSWTTSSRSLGSTRGRRNLATSACPRRMASARARSSPSRAASSELVSRSTVGDVTGVLPPAVFASAGEISRSAGNSFALLTDYLSMDCFDIRSSVSASLDGEDPGLPDSVVRGHLAECAGCRAYSADVSDLHRMVRVQP